MHRSSSIPPHRQSRRAQRRQKMRRIAVVAVVSLTTMWAFGAGYLWRQLRAKSAAAEPKTEQVIPQQRAQALELLDRAVAAKHGELTSEAVRLVNEVRQTDPQTPGLDIFIGEMALEQAQFDLLSAAALAALEVRPSAHAKLLLALERWMRRGHMGHEAGANAIRILEEASAYDLANSPVRFFLGDFLQATGRPSEARSNMLGSLHRLEPWDSYSLLAAKLWFSLDEAGSKGKPSAALAVGPEGEIFGASAVQARRILRDGGETASTASLQNLFTAKQKAELSSDPALVNGASAAAAPSEEQLSLPFAGFDSPSESEAGAPTKRAQKP